MFLEQPVNQGEFFFAGVIEIYNSSNRSNAVREYEIWAFRNDKWEQLESERYYGRSEDHDAVYNHTPLTLPPYSGAEAHVQGIAKGTRPYEMKVRVVVEEIFGKKYTLEVNAVAG